MKKVVENGETLGVDREAWVGAGRQAEVMKPGVATRQPLQDASRTCVVIVKRKIPHGSERSE
jgi:hypothetical protein